MLGVLEEPLGLVMELVQGRPLALKPNFEVCALVHPAASLHLAVSIVFCVVSGWLLRCVKAEQLRIVLGAWVQQECSSTALGSHS